MRSALFVDFDNVYSGLRRLDQAVADRFAFQPQGWIRWLVDSLPAPVHSPEGASRRLLVRRCYLNPQVYQRFRPAFNRAGFEIIDCPAMTSEGKTSTDIHMVLDIVDLLQHQVHYDEFIVFSADADFTPVLRKLRRWDRRTTVLAIGFPSAAYQASADLLIDQDEFIRSGLGFGEPDEPAPPLPAAAPAPAAAPPGDAAATAIAQAPPEAGAGPAAADAAAPADGAVLADGDAALAAPDLPLSPAADPIAVLADVSALVRAEAARARRPVPCSRLAQLIIARHRPLAADWGGRGSFRRFMDALDLAPLALDWTHAGGHVFDPALHGGDPALGLAFRPPGWDGHDALLQLVSQVHQATGVPVLSPDEVATLLRALADDLRETPFALSETGKRVRDRCRDAGHAVSRSDVSFLLKGLMLDGHSFGQGSDDPQSLGRRLCSAVLDLCQREQLPLDAAQTAALQRWLGLD